MRSWNRSLSLAAAMAFGLVLLAPLSAQAQQARRASLDGNRLIEDLTDVYANPQLLGKYRNIISFGMGTDYNTGDGLLIFGNDTMAFGLAAHRSDNLNPLGALATGAAQSASLLNGAATNLDAIAMPGTVFDAMLSLNMGDAAALGFRLGFAHGGTSAGPDGQGPSVTQILLEGGYSMFGDTRIDLGLFFALGLGSDDTGGGDVSATDINIGVNGRIYLPMEEQVELGLLGDLGVGFGSTSSGGADGPSSFNLGINVGAGPVYKLEHARIAAYAMVGFNTSSTDSDANGDTTSSGNSRVIIPGINMAAEIDLTEWFHFRAGLEAAWAIDSQNAEGDDDGSSSTGAQFGWSTGFGLTFDRFKFDLAFADSFWTRGPHFISGNSGTFGASAAASYSF